MWKNYILTTQGVVMYKLLLITVLSLPFGLQAAKKDIGRNNHKKFRLEVMSYKKRATMRRTPARSAALIHDINGFRSSADNYLQHHPTAFKIVKQLENKAAAMNVQPINPVAPVVPVAPDN